MSFSCICIPDSQDFEKISDLAWNEFFLVLLIDIWVCSGGNKALEATLARLDAVVARMESRVWVQWRGVAQWSSDENESRMRAMRIVDCGNRAVE